jgi:hypothetical protein
LLLITGFPLDGERNILVRQRFQGRFGDKVLSGAEHSTRETAKQVSEGLLLCIPVREGNCHHDADTSWHQETVQTVRTQSSGIVPQSRKGDSSMAALISFNRWLTAALCGDRLLSDPGAAEQGVDQFQRLGAG